MGFVSETYLMDSSEPGGEPDSFSDLGMVVVLLISTFMGIGLLGTFITDSSGTFVTWFWMGIGVSVTYLLFHLALSLHQITHDIRSDRYRSP